MEVICNIVGKIKIPKQQPGKEEDKMGTKLAKILDECLARTDRGESIDACLSDYTEAREQIEPLLRTAISFSSMPEVAPSDSYKKTTKRRLMATLHQETFPAKIATLDENMSPLDNLAMAIQRLWQTITGARKIAIPVTLGLILAIVAGFGASSFISPSPALADGCTLSIISGTVDIQAPTSDSQPGINGMTLDVGTRIQTGQDATALLTFFDGSTLKLEPGTDIEIQQLEFNDEQSVTIVLKQLIGRTWSHVVKMADKGSHYEIITPSAVALVRGTQFVIDVDEEGNTREQTTEGLVSVIAQGEEVSVPVGYITMVETGTIPSEPTIAPDPEDEKDSAKDEAKALEDAAKDEAKALEDAAKDEAKAQEDAAKDEAKALEDAAKDEAKALEDAAKDEAKALEDAAKDEAKALEDAAKDEAKALEDAAKDDDKDKDKDNDQDDDQDDDDDDDDQDDDDDDDHDDDDDDHDDDDDDHDDDEDDDD